MALENYNRNLYGPQKFVDLNIVLIKVRATGRDADNSSPDTTVTDSGSGQYAITFPKAQHGWISAQYGEDDLSSGAVSVFIEQPVYTSGTVSMQLSTGAALVSNAFVDIILVLANS